MIMGKTGRGEAGENVIRGVPTVTPLSLCSKFSFYPSRRETRAGTLQPTCALRNGSLLRSAGGGVQSETAGLEEEEGACSSLFPISITAPPAVFLHPGGSSFL